MPGLKHHIRSAIVFTPVAGKDPAFRIQSLIEARAGKRGQDVEGRILHSAPFQEFQRLLENGLAVVIESEDDSRLHGYAMRMNLLDRLRILVDAIECFRDFTHARLRN